MRPARHQFLANFGGQAFSGLLSLLFVPVYLHYLGAEAYGLVGFFISLQAVLTVLDAGLSTTANRELARRSAQMEGAEQSRNIVFTLQAVYFAVGLLLSLIFYLLSEPIAVQWVVAKELPLSSVRSAVILFGIVIGIRWPVALYSGVLRGLERQVLLNIVNGVIALLKHAGSALVIIFFSQTVVAFFQWQLFAGIVEICLFFLLVSRSLPSTVNKPRFDWPGLRKIARFTTGLAFISIFAAALKQSDKILLSKLLPLEQLGYYSAAAVATSAVSLVFFSGFHAVFPKFSSLISQGDQQALARLFHRAAKGIAFLACLTGGIIMFFSYDILLLWTQSSMAAENAHWPMSILAFAAIFNAMMQVPYALQLAAGLTSIALWNNGISLLLFVPLSYYLISRFGLGGAALPWALFNLCYYLIIPHVMHRYILKQEKMRWIFQDTLPFLLLTFFIFGGLRILSLYSILPEAPLILVTIGTLLYIGISMVVPQIRAYFVDGWRSISKHGIMPGG